jgi:invasion protein IalB
MVRTAAIVALASALPGAALAQGGGPDLLQETYRDWQVRCETVQGADSAAPARVCELAQEVTQAESGQRIVTIALQAMGDETAGLSVLGPFGLDLATGITLLTGETEAARLPFRTCLPVGCVATAPLDALALDQLAAAEALELRMAADGGQPVSITLSLAGFGAGWTRLQALGAE